MKITRKKPNLSLNKITGQRIDQKLRTYVSVNKETSLPASTPSRKKIDNIKEGKWKY